MARVDESLVERSAGQQNDLNTLSNFAADKPR
jgi:hypothetical protein